MIESPQFNEHRGAWLTKTEVDRFDLADQLDTALGWVRPGDVAAVFGAGGGGISAYLRHRCRVAGLVLIENDDDALSTLSKSFRNTRGITIVERDPVEAMVDVLDEFRPNVAVLDLHGRELDPATIFALAQPNDSLEVLWIVYQDLHDERSLGLNEMITTWHDESHRWEWNCQTISGADSLMVYVR